VRYRDDWCPRPDAHYSPAVRSVGELSTRRSPSSGSPSAPARHAPGLGRFTSFLPAISKDALNKISGEVRRWRLHRRTRHSFAELARRINPTVRGWTQYYGALYRSALCPLLARINAYLMRWIRKKYKRLRPLHKALGCWRRITRQHPRLFVHWTWVRVAW
jgi:hypothetical protein